VAVSCNGKTEGTAQEGKQSLFKNLFKMFLSWSGNDMETILVVISGVLTVLILVFFVLLAIGRLDFIPRWFKYQLYMAFLEKEK